MRRFIIKIFTLAQSIHIAGSSSHVSTRSHAIISIPALYAACDVSSMNDDCIWNDPENESCEVTNYTRDKGKTVEEITHLIYASVMKRYETIVPVENFNLPSKTKKQIDPTEVVRTLITFDIHQLKQLSLLRKRFRLFYFLKVHEIISLLNDITKSDEDQITKSGEENIWHDFWELLNRLGDLEFYNHLFINPLAFSIFDQCCLFIPQDIMKIVAGYCHWSIYDTDDLNFILKQLFM